MNICELLENNLNQKEVEIEIDESSKPKANDEKSVDKPVSENNTQNEEDDVDYNKMIDFFSTTDSIDYKASSTISIPGQTSESDSSSSSNSSIPSNEQTDNQNYSLLSNDDEQSYDSLNPFEKFFKHCDNPTPSNIETASKYVVPALEFATSQEDYMRVFFYLKKFCFYSDVLLRSLWLEQIQNVIQYLHQEHDNINIEFNEEFNMAHQLALLISDLMREPAYQVKKCATASLLYIIERQLLVNKQIEQIIIPCLLSLVKENNEDFHIDCVSLFGKLAPLIGQELTTKYFLEPFCRLCSSPVFHTRKACASNIAEIANVVSAEDVEKYLLPHFCEFMKDQVWAIRKVCADLFSIFASKCKRQTRENILTECFTRLLDDHSRWVKISAYKSLGSFIATFARTESELAELEKKERDKEEENLRLNDSKKEGEYSNFMYWRNTLPSLDDSSLQTEKDSTPTLTNLLNDNQSKSCLYSSTSSLFTASNQLHQQNTSQQQASLIDQLSKELNQEIVPPILLSYFVTMIDVNTQNSLDSEMNYNCAYNFPAIALTLGVKYWKYIKNLYKKLAEDLSWKVRQTLAFSIHELAIILGTENTQNDLVPVFDSYIKDVDEVRIGIVSNLTKFLNILSLEYRTMYMPKLNDFLKMDNQRNWRFRNELGLQISKFCELFPCDCLAEFVQPVTFTLALDKIAEVRLTAVKALVEILRQFELNKRDDLRLNFIEDVHRTFANSNKWTFRQLYVVMCETLLKTNVYSSFEQFCVDFLPKLLLYRNEKVPNIRVLVAKVLSFYVINNEIFRNGRSSLLNELELTIQYLSNDPDTDVRSHFVHFKISSNNLPSYDDLYKNNDNEKKDQMDVSVNSESGLRQNEENKMNHDEDEDDDEDDEDEIIDKTKINQLKIVNLENEIDEHETSAIDGGFESQINSKNNDLKPVEQSDQLLLNKNNQEIVLN